MIRTASAYEQDRGRAALRAAGALCEYLVSRGRRGAARRAAPRDGSRRQVAVDVLVEPAAARAHVTGEAADGNRSAALKDIRAALVLRRLTLVGSPDRVAPVGPRAEGSASLRRDPQVVARKRDRPIRELLVVRVGRHVGEARRGAPRPAARRLAGAERVEGRTDVPGRVVSDRALRRVVG